MIRGEFSERLVTLEEDNKNLKSELVECKTRHKLEVERQKRLHEDEMTEVCWIGEFISSKTLLGMNELFHESFSYLTK